MCRAGLLGVVYPDFRARKRLCEVAVSSRDWSAEKKKHLFVGYDHKPANNVIHFYVSDGIIVECSSNLRNKQINKQTKNQY